MREEKLILYNMRLFDGETNLLQKGKSIVIEGGRIREVEDGGRDASDFPGYKMVDMKNLTLLPGFIDNHVHMTIPFMLKITLEGLREIDNQIKRNFQACINSGVTTVRDVGAFPRKMNNFISMVNRGEIPGPRVLCTNSVITTQKGSPDWVPYFNFLLKAIIGGQYAERPRTPLETKNVVKKMIQKGADWIKLYCQSKSWLLGRGKLPIFNHEQFHAAVDTAKELGKKTCCHIIWLKDFQYAISMGVNTAEHSVLDREIPYKVIEEFIKRDMALHPTLNIFDLGNTGYWEKLDQLVHEKGELIFEPEALQQVKNYFDTYIRKKYPPNEKECRKNCYLDIPLHEKGYPIALKNVLKIYKSGGRVGVGTDSGGSLMAFFGVLYPEELKRMVKSGLTNYEVLKAATSVNAKILNMDDKIGSIRKGKLADLVAVEGNPLEDIKAIKNVKIVFKGGKIVDGYQDT